MPHIANELARVALAGHDLTAGPGADSTILRAVLPRLGVSRPTSEMVTDLLASAATYDLKPITVPSPTFPLHPLPGRDGAQRAQCRALYLAAFKEGKLAGAALNILKHGRVVRPGQLEIY